MKDIELLRKNKDYLKEKGIYFHFDDNDVTKMWALITPRHKHETSTGLTSPYTGGFFLFEVKFEDDYPLSPPKVEFNPKTSMCRFHPNYYTTGKVCLSIINTWAGADWSPSMSLMALLVTLEERFFERALGCEPGHTNDSISVLQSFNNFVEYHKYNIAILDVLKRRYRIYEPFYDVISEEIASTKEWHMTRIETLINSLHGHTLQQPVYNNSTLADYSDIKSQMICF